MLHLITIFLGAFLLFLVQPLIAKVILPSVGGGASVWTTCMLFFQAMLFLGYGYAHLLSRYFRFKQQLTIHSALLLIACLLYWLLNQAAFEVKSVENPMVDIFLYLLKSVGLPYFLLSATGPLVQKWLVVTGSNKNPYRLYSLSNVASLVALASFPFLFEVQFSLSSNRMLWGILFTLYVIVFVFWLVQLSKENSKLEKVEERQVTEQFGLGTKLLWLLYSAIGVVVLVSTTSAMTQNVPPVPFLWILPLALYLITFIVCFRTIVWYQRSYFQIGMALVSVIAIMMYFTGTQFDIHSQVLLYSVILLTACLVCHAELVKLTPSKEHLTSFYLYIAFGGVLGSALVSLLAPVIFEQFYEYPLVFSLIFVAVGTSIVKEKSINFSSVVSYLFAGALLVGVWYLDSLYHQTSIYKARNFYGVLSVKDIPVGEQTERRLIDGTTSHGSQYLSAQDIPTPLSYYRKNTGVAIGLETLSQDKAIKVGLVGMGAGTLAAYGNDGDEYHFFELNPAVKSAANEYFSYLNTSPAKTDIVLGDGRVSLQRLANQGKLQAYDAIVVDAFSGDSIPQHLLTKEAIALYLSHLHDDGILMFHISNSHLDIKPIMSALSGEFALQARYFYTKAKNINEHDTEWVWLTNNERALNGGLSKIYGRPLRTEQRVLWTDQYSNLFSILK